MRVNHAAACLALGLLEVVAGTPMRDAGERRAFKHHAVTGVKVEPGSYGVPLRLNINDLEAAGGPQWTLYIRALQAMQNQNHDDELSYFQIAGIHGKPFIEWDNDGGAVADEDDDVWQGYCPHMRATFASWHRPYVMLFEQTLVDHAKKIALTYPERVRGEYITAAATLRQPFWDWGYESQVPPCTIPDTIEVDIPEGERLVPTKIDNPLRTYKLPKKVVDGEEYGVFDEDRKARTERCTEEGKGYPDSANELMAERPYKSWLYDTFSRSESFEMFSTTTETGVSLEQIHNGVHWDAGCGGHFLAAEFSAFDPIFMLHHANVDRLWAYWSALRPDIAAFNSSYLDPGRFGTPANTLITPDSPLRPFRGADGEYLTSNTVANITGLGYSYHGLEYWAKTPAEMKRDTKRLLNRLYSSDAQGVARVLARGGTRRYIANVQIDVTEVETPCEVSVFVGKAKAGSIVLMKEPKKGVQKGAVPLDGAIEKAGVVLKGEDGDVEAVMESITVAITKFGGASLPLPSKKGLQIEVEDVEIKSGPTAEEFPVFGRSRVTAARIGEDGRMRL